MSEKYFANFPTISYNGQQIADLTRRVALLSRVAADPKLYYSKDVKQRQRADNVADVIYDDPYQEWLIFLANGVIDPWKDWPLDDDVFGDYVSRKYGSIAAATQMIDHYRNAWYDDDSRLSTAAYSALPPGTQQYWTAMLDEQSNPLAYVRTQQDWTVSTNGIKTLGLASVAGFLSGENVVVTRAHGDAYTGRIVGVPDTTSNLMTIQHLSDTDPDVLEAGYAFVTGKTSHASSLLQSSSVNALLIPDVEQSYWAPVTAYDVENEANVARRTIRILDPRFAQLAASELGRLMQL